MTIMKQFHWFWAWEDDKEEDWLRGMAQKGWHFRSVSLPGNYVFEHGDPRDDVYRLDYFTNSRDKTDYLQLFLDAGWEYLGEMNSWQYFRKAALNGESPEIFTDNESKAKKYQRVLFILVVAMLLMVNNLFLLNRQHENPFGFLTFLQLLLALFFSYGSLRLLYRINQLKKKI